MIETWADRSDYRGKPAGTVICPCCGRQRAADMIVRVGEAFRALDEPTRDECLKVVKASQAPEYVCTGRLAKLRRRKLVTREQLPNRKVLR